MNRYNLPFKEKLRNINMKFHVSCVFIVILLLPVKSIADVVQVSDLTTSLNKEFDYYNREQYSGTSPVDGGLDECWRARLGSVTTNTTLASCAQLCKDKEAAERGGCAGMAFKITTYVAKDANATKGECVIKGSLANVRCPRVTTTVRNFNTDTNEFQILRYPSHNDTDESPTKVTAWLNETKPVPFDLSKLTPAAFTIATDPASPTLPTDKSIKYNSVEIAQTSTGGIFCKSVTKNSTKVTFGTVSFDPLPAGNTSSVRCYAYIPSTTTAIGSCYIKDFLQSNVTAAANPAPQTVTGSSWTKDTATTVDALQCSIEAPAVVAALQPAQKALVLTDFTALTPALAPGKTSLTVGGITLANLPSGKTGGFFCKSPILTTSTIAPIMGALVANNARCFAYINKGTTAGDCYVKDFAAGNYASTTNDVVAGGWAKMILADNNKPSYCGYEGDATIRSAIWSDPFAESLSIKALSATPTAAILAESVNTIFTFGHHTNFTPIVMGPAVTDTSYFCKTAASKPSALTAGNIRCFAFSKATATVAGKCYTKDLVKGSVPTVAQVLTNTAHWTPQADNKVCSDEGGPTVVTAYTPPVVFDSTKFIPTPITANTVTVAATNTLDVLSYGSTKLAEGATFFCKTVVKSGAALVAGSVRCFAYMPSTPAAPTAVGACYTKDFKDLASVAAGQATAVTAANGTAANGWVAQNVAATTADNSYCATEAGGTYVRDAIAPLYSTANFTPAPTTAAPTAEPADKTLKYKDTTLSTATDGAIFCKTTAIAATAAQVPAGTTVAALASGAVRCFNFTNGSEGVGGKCSYQDFDATSYNTAVAITSWKALNPTAGTAAATTFSYCDTEGGDKVKAKTKPIFTFSSTSFVPTPITDNTVTVTTANTLGTLSYGSTELAKDATFFCKTVVKSGTALATGAVRCFAYMAPTATAVGACYIKDFEDMGSVAGPSKAVTTDTTWIAQNVATTTADNSYCATEAGGTFVRDAIAPLYATTNFTPAPTAVAPTAEPTDKILKYKNTTISTATDGAIFCKTTAIAATAAQVPAGTTVAALASGAVRCFNFTYGSEGMGGKCSYQDFDATSYNTPVAITAWKVLNATTGTAAATTFSYCDTEGGDKVKAKTKPIFTFANTSFTPTPLAAGVDITAANAEASTKQLLKYGTADLATGATFFCKTITKAAGTPATTFGVLNGTGASAPVRCFAYMAPTATAVGACYTKDFKDMASVAAGQATAVTAANGWVAQNVAATTAATSYCATEAGGTYVRDAIEPLYSTSKFDPVPTAAAPTLEPGANVLKYKDTILTTATDGAIFCKTTAIAATAAQVPAGTTVGALASGAVRCFNFTNGSEGVGGKCSYQDFNSTTYNTPVAITAWKVLNATTGTAAATTFSYCDTEGGDKVKAKTKPIFTFTSTSFTPTPLAAGVDITTANAEASTKQLLKYGTADLATGATFFCKTAIKSGAALAQGAVRCFAYMAPTATAVGACYIKDFKDMASVAAGQPTAVTVANGWIAQNVATTTAATSYCATEAGGTYVRDAIAPLYATTNFTPVPTAVAPTAEPTDKILKYKDTTLSTATDGAIFCKTTAIAATAAQVPAGTTVAALASGAVRCFNFTNGSEDKGGNCSYQDFNSTNYNTPVAITSWKVLNPTAGTAATPTLSYCDTEGGDKVQAKTKPLVPAFDTSALDGDSIWGLRRGLNGYEGYAEVEDKKFCSTIDPKNKDMSVYLEFAKDGITKSSDCNALCSKRVDCAYVMYIATPAADLQKCYLLSKKYSNERCTGTLNDLAGSGYTYKWKKIDLDYEQADGVLPPASTQATAVSINKSLDGKYLWGLGRGTLSDMGYANVDDGSFCSTIDPAKKDMTKYLEATSDNITKLSNCTDLCNLKNNCAYVLYSSAATGDLKKCYLLSKEYSNENCTESFIKTNGYSYKWKKLDLDYKQ